MKYLPLILLILLSCQAPTKTETGHKSKLGKTVSALDEAIWSIHQDKNHHYWLGSNEQGVFHYNGKELVQFTKEDGLVGHQIRGIQEDKAGHIYFDTPDGISKYDGHSFTTLAPIFSPTNEWKLDSTDLWFKGDGNTNGVYRYDGESLFHLKFPEQDLEAVYGMTFDESRFSSYGPYSIYQDKSKNMWFGMFLAGVYRYDGKSFFWIAEKELSLLEDGRAPGVRSIIEDKDGYFWLSNILYRYHFKETQNGEIDYQKLPGIDPLLSQGEITLPYFMSAVVDDESEDLWLLTYGQGVWRYDGVHFHHYHIMDGEKEVFLFSIYQDRQGTLLLGTHNAGVYQFDGKGFVKKVFPHNRNNF